MGDELGVAVGPSLGKPWGGRLGSVTKVGTKVGNPVVVEVGLLLGLGKGVGGSVEAGTLVTQSPSSRNVLEPPENKKLPPENVSPQFDREGFGLSGCSNGQ